jgi:hypothetical protein
MNRRDTSLAALIGVPAVLAGVTAALAQQGPQGQQAPGQALHDLKKPLVLAVTGDLVDKETRQKVGTLEGSSRTSGRRPRRGPTASSWS